jgi:hypothetical protein
VVSAVKIFPKRQYPATVQSVNALWTCHNRFHVRALQTFAEEADIEEHFDAISGEEDWSPRFNVAPTHPLPGIRPQWKE